MAKKSNPAKKSSKKTINKKNKNKPAEVKTKDTSKSNLKKKPMNEKPSFMKKNLRLIVPAIVLICIISLVLLALNPGILGSDEAKAELKIEYGAVQVKHEGSWTVAKNGMDLYQSDSVKTGDDSAASIILFKGSIIRLDSNTEVTLKELIKEDGTSVTIEQSAGRTWNTIQGISGIDNYEVETPTTVASVRGTSFDVNVDEDGITVVSVVKGIVNVTTTETGTVYTVQLGENYSVTVDFDSLGQPQSFEPDDWISDNLLKDDEFKEDLKAIIYDKIEPYLVEAKEKYEITEEEIDILLEGFINGEFEIDFPENTPDWIKDIIDLS